jgi:hypothetical protein
MAETIFNIDSYIEDLKTAQKQAAAKKVAAEAAAKQKKSESNAAKRVRAEANNKFQYAEGLGKTLIDFEGQLKSYGTKIARGDVLTAIEQRDFDYAVKQYKSVSTAYTTALNEGNAILAKMPAGYTEGPTGPTGATGGTGTTGATGSTTPIAATTIGLTDFLKGFIGNTEKTKQLQQALFNAGEYKGPIDGVFRADVLKPAAERAEVRLDQYAALEMPFADRFEGYKRLQPTGGAGGAGVPTTTISPRATATTYIDAALKSLGINRDATPEEIDNLTKVLNDAESRFKTTTKNGVTRDLLGNRTQFLTNLITTGKYVDPNTGKPIKGVKEDVKKAAAVLGTLSKSVQGLKADTRSLSVQTLRSTANANGVSLSQQQLDQYALDIQNGKDIKVIQSQIRNIAGAGMPDNVKKLLAEGTDLETVYAPYRTQMAAILEVNPETINFTDPALRNAIGPNGEMSIYDFQRALRKDARWQYTNNAREDVFQSVSKVLQDFGFQG